MQKFMGFSIVALGAYLRFNDVVFIGIVLLIIGMAVNKGGDHDSWISFEFGSSDGSDSGDGGGD